MSTARQRILRATAGVLSWQPQDADGEPATAGTVTIGIARSDGSTVIAAGAATAGTGNAVRTYTLAAAATADLDWLTATWSVDGVATATTVHEIVGGYYFAVADLRGREPSTGDAARDSVTAIVAARAEVEDLIESACGVAFVPRFAVVRIQVPSSGRLSLPWARVRRIRWIRSWSSDSTYTAVDADTVAAIPPSPSGAVSIGVAGDIEIGLEHGYDPGTFSDVTREAIAFARAQRARPTGSAALDRATSMQLADGSSVTLATPGVRQWHTGIPTVDEMLIRRDHRAMIA